MVPMNPDIMKGMAALTAHIEAQRAKVEPNLNTPEGRKRAAEVKLAEKKRKENNWLSRVIIDRGNGWKPIWGSAVDEELRIYTLVKSDEHRFWGIKPIGMGIDEFWEKNDPEVRRHEDRQQETPVDPNAPTGTLIGEPLRNTTPPKKVAAKQRRRQRTPEINPTHRIRKPSTVSTSSKMNKSTRKSLADKVDAVHSELEEQARDMTESTFATGRATRNKKVITASGAQQAATKLRASAPSERPRGRPPVKGKLTEQSPKQEKTPAVKGNAKVTKSSQIKQRPSALPSTHKMRTRRKGPAELLQLP
ncbi:MAG: hypothetical protein ASARMPREDX12_001606 [Alectoria sarmentosa]|nr:MAG: hypothetical protein ASARMPREDX12_001606 [Alectoria sarmentosa]